MARGVCVIGVIVAAASFAANAESTVHDRPRCERPGSTVLVNDAEVTIYGYLRGSQQGTIYACDGRATDRYIGDPTGDFYRPPVMALEGSTTAIVTDGPANGLKVRVALVNGSAP